MAPELSPARATVSRTAPVSKQRSWDRTYAQRAHPNRDRQGAAYTPPSSSTSTTNHASLRHSLPPGGRRLVRRSLPIPAPVRTATGLHPACTATVPRHPLPAYPFPGEAGASYAVRFPSHLTLNTPQRLCSSGFARLVAPCDLCALCVLCGEPLRLGGSPLR